MRPCTLLTLLLVSTAAVSYSQDDLIRSLSGNLSPNAKEAFIFSPVVELRCTGIKNQESSSTCWSYSGNSFLESEMIRMGRQPVDLAEMYTARSVLLEKAINFVRMHGALSWGQGGEVHDVMNMYEKYGAVPQEIYPGLNYGTKSNKLAEMQEVIRGILDGVVKNPNGKLTPSWLPAINAVLDTYLGEVPESFTYQGKKYTPRSFADKLVAVDPAAYVELASLAHSPYYRKVFLPVPDNWSFEYVYNIPMNDLTNVIDSALHNGFTVGWATDVTERYFSWKNGMALVPARPVEQLNESELSALFNSPNQEAEITEKTRQEAFDNYETQDDHAMHIIGISKDQFGKTYYKVKNTWGTDNDRQGYIYVTKAYVNYKTIALYLHKDGLPKGIRARLGI